MVTFCLNFQFATKYAVEIAKTARTKNISQMQETRWNASKIGVKSAWRSDGVRLVMLLPVKAMTNLFPEILPIETNKINTNVHQVEITKIIKKLNTDRENNLGCRRITLAADFIILHILFIDFRMQKLIKRISIVTETNIQPKIA